MPILAFLKLIPLRDWLWLAAVTAIVSYHFYTVHEAAVHAAEHEVAALRASSDALTKQNDARIAGIDKQHAAEVAKVKGDLDVQLQSAATQHDLDAQRLREYDAYRRAHPVVGSTPGGSGSAGQGTDSAGGSSDSFASLEQVALGLATAARETNSALSACMIERDSLNGK